MKHNITSILGKTLKDDSRFYFLEDINHVILKFHIHIRWFPILFNFPVSRNNSKHSSKKHSVKTAGIHRFLTKQYHVESKLQCYSSHTWNSNSIQPRVEYDLSCGKRKPEICYDPQITRSNHFVQFYARSYIDQVYKWESRKKLR